MKHALHKAKVAAQKAKVASKYQQTQPKKQGRNQRGRRPPAMVTIAAKPFDWRKFKATDYVPVEPEPKHTDPLKG